MRSWPGLAERVPSSRRGPAPAVRILGIDPGSVRTGYGVIDMEANRAVHIAHGFIDLKAADIGGKMKKIFNGLCEIIDEFRPQEAAIERVFMHLNADAALKLGQARGASLAACAIRDIEVHEYTANQVKKTAVGRGHAEKHQVQHMMKVLLCLPGRPQADAADALANALCHGHSREGGRRMGPVRGVRRGRLR